MLFDDLGTHMDIVRLGAFMAADSVCRQVEGLVDQISKREVSNTSAAVSGQGGSPAGHSEVAPKATPVFRLVTVLLLL